MLSFCIPTWNRAEKLRLCLESIGEATKGYPVDIFVYNNGSTDHTPEVLQEASLKYPVIFKTGATNLPFEQSYANATSMASQPWTWTFGDDDLLLDFKSLFPLLHTDVEFIHVTESTRAGTEKSIYPGSLLELCKSIGWIDMTGFISGNIFRTEPMRAVMSGPRQGVYGESAFPQSLAALEAFHDRKAVLVDAPIVGLQDEEQTPDTIARWNAGGMVMKYSAVSKGLALLQADGILPATLPPEFFRYLSGSFIAKCMHAFWTETINTSTKLSNAKWSEIEYAAGMFEGDIRPVVKKFRQTLDDYCDVCERGMELVGGMEKLCAEATPFTYPSTYV